VNALPAASTATGPLASPCCATSPFCSVPPLAMHGLSVPFDAQKSFA
jgi:hypothetical protein